MTRDIAAHVRLAEQGLPEQPERDHVFVPLLGHPVFPVRVEPGTAVVARHVHGLAVTRGGVPVLLVAGPYERVELDDGEGGT